MKILKWGDCKNKDTDEELCVYIPRNFILECPFCGCKFQITTDECDNTFISIPWFGTYRVTICPQCKAIIKFCDDGGDNKEMEVEKTISYPYDEEKLYRLFKDSYWARPYLSHKLLENKNK